MPIIKQCAYCGITIKVPPSKNSSLNFCNRECYNNFHRRGIIKKVCAECGREFEVKNTSNANKYCSRDCYNKSHMIRNKERECPACHKIFTAKTSEDKYCSRECYDKGRIMPSGKDHWNWQNGITPENEKLRKSSQYLHWRDNVFTRDQFKCIYCGSAKKLNAHHVLSWKLYPKLRFEESNGITVCEICHRKIHAEFGYQSKEKMILQKDKKLQ